MLEKVIQFVREKRHLQMLSGSPLKFPKQTYLSQPCLKISSIQVLFLLLFSIIIIMIIGIIIIGIIIIEIVIVIVIVIGVIVVIVIIIVVVVVIIIIILSLLLSLLSIIAGTVTRFLYTGLQRPAAIPTFVCFSVQIKHTNCNNKTKQQQ